MNVTFLCDKLNINRGGSNHSLDLLARRLSMRDHEVSVVTLNFIHENSLPEDPPYTVTTDPVGRTSAPGKAAEIYRKLSTYDEQSDLLHVFNPALLPIAGRYRNREGTTPIVGRLNTYDSFCTNLNRMDSSCYRHCSVARKFAHDDRSSSEKLSSIPRYIFDTHALPSLANGVDRFFALSPTVADVYGEIGLDEHRIDVVPNCIDPEFGTTTDVTPFPTDRQTLLYVGRLDEQKGVDLLIDALRFLETPSAYHLELVGDGPRRDQLERQVRREGWSQQVTFHGWVAHDQLPDYYTNADLFVHPGRWPEPFGRTIIEAMQCATPVVVSDVGGPPWIVDSPQRVFEWDDAADLARTVEAVLAEPSSRFTDQDRQRLRRFTPETVVSDIETKYVELLETASGKG
jgi:glycosyltransferase involved in cell wall biosynthesis